jgi:hypothetical protein
LGISRSVIGHSSGPKDKRPETNDQALATDGQAEGSADRGSSGGSPPVGGHSSADPPRAAINPPPEDDDAGLDRAAREPEALLARLDDIAWECETGLWAREVARLARRTILAIERGQDQPLGELGQLAELVNQAPALADSLNDDLLSSNVRRAEYAVRRRIDVWQQAAQIHGASGGAAAGRPGETDSARLAACLDKVDALTSGAPEGQSWRHYLGLDALRGVIRRAKGNDTDARWLARRILHHMTRSRLTPQQQEFLALAPLAELRSELGRWAAGSADHREVLRHVERYEESGLPSDAQALAEDYQCLGLSPLAEGRQLSERLESHYRNANFRAVVTGDLLNRLTPLREPELTLVDDRVMGRPVHGQSLNAADVRVRLISDPARLRLALEVQGQVSALTSSSAGPATFQDASQSYYTAWKELELGTWGIRAWPAQVSVQNNDIRLRAVRTDFDRIPLLRELVQGVARSQHEQSKSAVSAELARKIEAQAKAKIDTETEARLGTFSRRLQQQVLAPLDEMQLEPTVISAETSPQRLVMRLRVAAIDQLGGHTPRPQAPADSLASVQIHESLLNNILQRLDLAGHTLTVAELRQRLASRMPKAGFFERDPETEDAQITFAKHDALRIRCDEGQMVLTLAIEALRRPPYHWRDFQVRIPYRARVEGRSITLARDGVIQLAGDRLNMRAQIALRGVFGKTFSQQRTFQLAPEGMLTDPRLADLAITQFTVYDGWIAVALGPSQRETHLAGRAETSRK